MNLPQPDEQSFIEDKTPPLVDSTNQREVSTKLNRKIFFVSPPNYIELLKFYEPEFVYANFNFDRPTPAVPPTRAEVLANN